ncbi:MAG: cytidyltransferase-related domain [Planctomycetota bacterium]|nr:MAG: cytidyltransferase-related domain [Planctomycetota bacterium]
MTNWEFLPACVRPHFVKRVVLYGPESAGKTTLARQLAEEFRTEWVPEYARGFIDRKGAFVEPADIGHVVAGQIASENAAARRANRILFCDSDVNTTVIYFTHYFGSVPAWVAHLSRRRTADLILFCEPDIPFEADSQRDQGHRRAWFREWFRARLDEQGRAWRSVTGLGKERVVRAARAVREALLTRLLLP